MAWGVPVHSPMNLDVMLLGAKDTNNVQGILSSINCKSAVHKSVFSICVLQYQAGAADKFVVTVPLGILTNLQRI